MNTAKMMFKGWVPAFLLGGMMLCASAAAEEFKDFTLKTLDGMQVSTESVRQDKVLVVKLGATWCGYCRQETNELKKLRGDFEPSDLSIVEVYLLETRETVAAHTKDLPFTILLDEDGAVAKLFSVTGIPVVLVVDTNGEIAYRGNYTPHVALRESVKTALAERKAKPSPKTAADQIEVREAAATMKICLLCGNIKGSAECVDYLGTQRATCPECGRVKGSPGCCKTNVQLADAGLCASCGLVKDSADCCNLQGKELCPSCGLVKGSAGCCKIL